MKPVIIVAMIALFNGHVAQADCTTLEGGFIDGADSLALMSLSSGINATLEKQGESVFVQMMAGKKQIFGAQLHDVYWDEEPEMGAPQIIAHDVNTDGILDVFIGTGRGMVNNYYQALISQSGGHWNTSLLISNPDFVCGDVGFGSWYRSGPRGTEEYWAIGDSGLPYVQITQTIIDSGLSHRVVFDAAGAMVSQSIVSDIHEIRQMPAPYHGKIVPANGDATLYEDTDMKKVVATLPAGTPVVLLETEETYSLVLVEYRAGARGWAVLEDVVYD